jgi:GntP family gluconate:H+ symporter
MSPNLLILVAVLSIVALIVLVAKLKLHPFLALLIVSIFMGLAGGLSPPDVIKNFEKGFGDVLSFVGIVIGWAPCWAACSWHRAARIALRIPLFH